MKSTPCPIPPPTRPLPPDVHFVQYRSLISPAVWGLLRPRPRVAVGIGSAPTSKTRTVRGSMAITSPGALRLRCLRRSVHPTAHPAMGVAHWQDVHRRGAAGVRWENDRSPAYFAQRMRSWRRARSKMKSYPMLANCLPLRHQLKCPSRRSLVDRFAVLHLPCGLGLRSRPGCYGATDGRQRSRQISGRRQHRSRSPRAVAGAGHQTVPDYKGRSNRRRP